MFTLNYNFGVTSFVNVFNNITLIILATLIFNPMINDLLEARGWRVTYCVLAAILLAVGLPAAATFRPPRKEDTEHAETDTTNQPSTNEDQRDDVIDLSTANQLDNNSNNGQQLQYTEHIPIKVGAPLNVGGTAVIMPTRTKVLLTSLWLMVSTLKAIGYYTPIFTFVSIYPI